MSGYFPALPWGLSVDCCHPYRNEKARDLCAEFRRIASRWIRREPAGVLLVHAVEIVRISE